MRTKGLFNGSRQYCISTWNHRALLFRLQRCPRSSCWRSAWLHSGFNDGIYQELLSTFPTKYTWSKGQWILVHFRIHEIRIGGILNLKQAWLQIFRFIIRICIDNFVNGNKVYTYCFTQGYILDRSGLLASGFVMLWINSCTSAANIFRKLLLIYYFQRGWFFNTVIQT